MHHYLLVVVTMQEAIPVSADLYEVQRKPCLLFRSIGLTPLLGDLAGQAFLRGVGSLAPPTLTLLPFPGDEMLIPALLALGDVRANRFSQ